MNPILFSTVSDPNLYLGGLLSITDSTASTLVTNAGLTPEGLGTGLRTGEFVVLCRTRQTVNSVVQPTDFLSDFLVGRINSFQSTDALTQGNPSATGVHVRLSLLGLYSTNADAQPLYYSRDIGVISDVRYWHVWKPDAALLDFLVNGTLGAGFQIEFGKLRVAESIAPEFTDSLPSVFVHMPDIRGKRTAMFGKTRLGKSNAVKLIMQGMMEMTAQTQDVGQLIFDVNGEYANDNPQDGNRSIASIYKTRSEIYFLAHRSSDSDDGPKRGFIRYNFYERTKDCVHLLTELLDVGVLDNEALRYFLQLEFPDFIAHITNHSPGSSSMRTLRRIQLLWTILEKAGFTYSEERLLAFGNGAWKKTDLFNPRFSQPLRMAMYQSISGKPVPRTPANLREMAREIEVFSKFALIYQNDPNLIEGGVPLIEKEEEIAMRFLTPEFGVGPRMLASCIPYHSEEATDFLNDIIASLDEGRTVIIDLGSANQTVLQFFSRTLSIAVFRHQEAKFVSNQLSNRFVQLYFEEAHMIFPANKPGHVTDIYSRFAKEGAKFHIGIVYSTQSPSTVSSELLSQTENFFIGHISNSREFALLGEVQHTFNSIGETVLKYRQPGYMQILTHSHRYVIPVQARVFNGSIIKKR